MRILLVTIIACIAMGFYGCRSTLTAPDFDMQNRQGERVSINDINSEYTLIYLNDIDCEDCHLVSDSLKNSAIINKAISNGKLAILSVYAGINVNQWKQQAPISERLECIDKEMSVFSKTEYQYETFPALFLLDKKKRFIIQNSTVSKLEVFFENKEK